ncbi:26066_t:CDS:2, partial [Gigaspora margarita]
SQSELPLWFSEGLKKLENISKFGVKIWHQIFDENQIKLLVPDKIFEFSLSEYDNIYSGIKNALDYYKMNTGCAPLIKINGFQNVESKTYLSILELW